MYGLSIGVGHLRLFNAALVGDHEIRVTVSLLDLEHRHLADLTGRFRDGQVDYDTTGDVDRSARLDLDDPDQALGFDSEAPTDGQVYADRMIQVVYEVHVPAISEGTWIEVPLITGPVVQARRDGTVMSVVVHGKEALARRGAWRTGRWVKGSQRVKVIEALMRDVAGESKFDFPDWGYRTATEARVNRGDDIWAMARRLTRAIPVPAQIYYDGWGTLRLREVPVRPMYVFRDGTGGTVLSLVQASYRAISEVVNTVHVIGPVPEGAKKPIEAVAVAPRGHQLSPHKLGRGGVPRHLVDSFEDSTIRGQKQAEKIAAARLEAALAEHVEVKFDSLVVPHVEPGDLFEVATGAGNVRFRLRQASIPLSADGSHTMPVGTTRQVSRRPIRGRRHRP